MYRSTQTYTVSKVESLDQMLNQVTDSTGMVVAILTDADFAVQYEEIPESN